MYRFLDHPSEEYIEVQAETIEGVFAESAEALFHVMTDISKIQPRQDYVVELEGETPEVLLIDWLNRLILLHETENVFLSHFQVRLERNRVWKLNALVRGEAIAEHHERRAHAKSATFGQLEWKHLNAGYQVRFVIDI